MQRIIFCLFFLMIVSPVWAETGKIKYTANFQTKKVEIERKFQNLEIKLLEAITKIKDAEKKNLEFEGKISKVELQNQVLREKIKSLESRRNLTFWSLVITIVITLLGWVVIIWKDFAVKKKEIKKSLEREAFKEINKAVTDLSHIITNISVTYLSLATPEPYNVKVPDSLELLNHKTTLYTGLANFYFAIEANEIAVIEFDHLRKIIGFKVDDLNNLIERFLSYISNSNQSGPLKDEIIQRCNKILEELYDIQGYLYDYRIELMNSMLGDVFHSKVPQRKPLDPNIKILTEAYSKEEVEKEFKKGERKTFEEK